MKTVKTKKGLTVTASTPAILSASRRTDIPAFHADWLMNRLREGYLAVDSTWSGKTTRNYVSLANTRFIVFWTKDPSPLIPHLDEIDKMGIGFYFQYTLNDYGDTPLEKNVKPLADRIASFKRISEKWGSDRVVWRFDPLVLTDSMDEDDLLSRMERVGDEIAPYTKRLVFSFADIAHYAKVTKNLTAAGVKYEEWTQPRMRRMGLLIRDLIDRKGWDLEAATCGELVDLSGASIHHGGCIDDRLIARISPDDPILRKTLGIKDVLVPSEDDIVLPDGRRLTITKNNRAVGQRGACRCISSYDIGRYQTCAHACEYCYATSDHAAAAAEVARLSQDPDREAL